MKRIKAIGHLLFSFRGRISRQMLWFAKLVLFVYVFLVGIPISLLAATAKTPRVGGLFVGLFYLSCVWSFLVIAIKRFHDRNLPGLWAILNLIPVWVFIYVSPLSSSPEVVARLIPSIVLLFCIPYIVQIFFLPGDAGANRYGPPPQSLKEWWESYGQFRESTIKE